VTNPSQTIARVYAQALYEVANEQGLVGRVHEELHALAGLAWKKGNEDIRDFILSPRIDRDTKWDLLEKALGDHLCRPMLGLIKVLIFKGREATLDNISRIHAHVTVAAPMDEALRQSLKARLEAGSGKTVRMHEKVDPSIIAGASIRVGDRVIDRTLRTKLAALRERLLETAT